MRCTHSDFSEHFCHPEVTLCCCQDVNIHLLTNPRHFLERSLDLQVWWQTQSLLVGTDKKNYAKNLDLFLFCFFPLHIFVYSPSNEHQSVMIVAPNSKWQVTFVEHAILSWVPAIFMYIYRCLMYCYFFLQAKQIILLHIQFITDTLKYSPIHLIVHCSEQLYILMAVKFVYIYIFTICCIFKNSAIHFVFHAYFPQ